MKKLIFKLQFYGVRVTALLILLTFASCKKDNPANGGSGSGYASTAIGVTDAPIDDASVTGAFVTISDIQLDGQSVQGFSKTTVDLNAYQNGSVRSLGNFNLQGKTYSSITFVLDFDMDATGNSPGCYVVSNGGVKNKLQTTSNIITVSKSFQLTNGVSSSLVADFNLRKMIIHQTGGGADHYDFVTAAEMSGAVHLVFENASGTISGTLTDNVSGSAKVIAYAYKKGTFNRATEVQGQGASNIEFKNAVSSALVNGSGNYQLHFLESGDFEVHFASYKDLHGDGQYELVGTLIVIGAGTIDLLNLTVSANATLTVNATATGVL